MKQHTTNYFNTLVEIAEDCPASKGEMPPLKPEKKSVASYQFELLYEHPYEYTSDEALFSVFAQRKEVSKRDWEEQRVHYFSKGQPCFRASPLTKRYGWGVHSDGEGKIALFGVESKEYQALVANEAVKKVKAMRSKRK